MHFSIAAEQGAIGVNYDRRVMVEPRRTALEDGSDDDHSGFSCERAQPQSGGARNGFGQAESCGVLCLAEVLGAKELRKTSDLDTIVCGLSQHGACAVEVFARVGRTPHLDQPDRKRSRFEAHVGFTFVATGRTARHRTW